MSGYFTVQNDDMVAAHGVVMLAGAAHPMPLEGL